MQAALPISQTHYILVGPVSLEFFLGERVYNWTLGPIHRQSPHPPPLEMFWIDYLSSEEFEELAAGIAIDDYLTKTGPVQYGRWARANLIGQCNPIRAADVPESSSTGARGAAVPTSQAHEYIHGTYIPQSGMYSYVGDSGYIHHERIPDYDGYSFIVQPPGATHVSFVYNIIYIKRLKFKIFTHY